MTKPLIDRSKYDHPEHFDDDIREYRTSERYIPTPLEHLLFELSGHRCTICHAPWLEIHHIKELADGGETTYENMIVLCPNCHTRVHSEGVPSAQELLQYKRKQEIAYELPVIAKLSKPDRALIRELTELPSEELVLFARRHAYHIDGDDQEAAVVEARKLVGHLYLDECGILHTQRDLSVTLDGQVMVALVLSLTSKGIKWVRYLQESGRIETLTP